MTYTVTLFNKHKASLNVVIFGDNISTLVNYVSGSLTTTHGVDTSPSDTILQVQAGTLAGGDKVVITYQVVIKSNVPDGRIVYNQGEVTSLETASKLTDWDGNEANGYQPTQFPVFIAYAPTPPGLYVQKLVAQLIDADHSSSNSPGDTMRYQFIIDNDGLIDLSNVTVDDIIPDGLTYVPGSVISSSGSSANVVANVLSSMVSSLPAGAQEMFVFNVTIDSPLYDAGTDGDLDNEVFINQADVNASGLSPGLSDGDGNKQNGNQSTQFTASTSGGGGGSSLLGPAIDKQGTHNGRWPDIDWTISIANQLNSVNLPIIISDSIPVDNSYTAGSIICTTPAGSLSVITSCLFDSINNRLYVIATLASDLGVGDMDLAQHKVIVEFKTRVNNASPARTVTNTANGFWDRNNNGRVIDDIIAGQTPVVASATVNAPAREIPTLSIPALIILCIMLILSTAYYRSRIKI